MSDIDYLEVMTPASALSSALVSYGASCMPVDIIFDHRVVCTDASQDEHGTGRWILYSVEDGEDKCDEHPSLRSLLYSLGVCKLFGDDWDMAFDYRMSEENSPPAHMRLGSNLVVRDVTYGPPTFLGRNVMELGDDDIPPLVSHVNPDDDWETVHRELHELHRDDDW